MPPSATHNLIGPSRSSTEARRPPHRRVHKRGRLRHEISSGGIIYRRRGVHIEIFFIKDPYGRWTFPKGHRELGETLIETAIREIEEETGLIHLRYVASVGRTTFRFRRKGQVIQKAVHFFLFEAPPTMQEKLTGEGAIWEATWARAHQAFSVSGYRNLDRLLSKALRLIGEEQRKIVRSRRNSLSH